MRPETIEKALEFVQEEINTLYIQQRNERLPDKKLPSQIPNYLPKLGVPAPQPVNMRLSKPFNFNMPGPSQQGSTMMPPRPLVPWRHNINQAQPFQGPSRTQQMFVARPPNHNPQNNSLRFQPPKGSTSNDTPKPMSGVSHFASKPMPFRGHDWSKQGNPPPSNYFKTREMNFNECYDYSYQYEPYDNYEAYQYDYNEYTETNYYHDMSLSQQPMFYSDTYPEAPVEAPVTENVSNDSNF